MPTYPGIGLKTVRILRLSCWYMYTDIEIDFEIILSYMKKKYVHVMIDKTIQMTFGMEVSEIICITKL